MGKKSKRSRPSGKVAVSGSGKVIAPALRRMDDEEETLENLKFQDPFEDVFEEEEIIVNNSSDEEEKQSVMEEKESAVTRAWTPSEGLQPGQTLEISTEAYTMHHSLTPEWPALSFDFIRDSYGNARTRFPHTVLCVVGTQASKREWNKIQVLKMTDLSRTHKPKLKYDNNNNEDCMDEDSEDDSSSDDDDDDAVDCDPALEHIALAHNGGVNRIRVMPNMMQPAGPATASTNKEQLFHHSNNQLVATWSDVGHVNVYDISSCLDHFEKSSGNFNNSSTVSSESAHNKKPFFTYRGHPTEGYAMDWSKVSLGHLATGDCAGQIHLWTPTESNFSVSCGYVGSNSVEDIQWSPTEKTVFAAASASQGLIQIYDTRRQGKSMISTQAHPGTDVNVIGWNSLVTNLLASGADDGTWSVWDLRTFGSNKKPEPLARFSYSKKPITSMEWHPTDESMILVTDEDAAYVYDLSIEADPEEAVAEEQEETHVPPQLLFLHCGSESTKEAHWHPQIPSLVMTTSLSGFNVFIPSNL
mmetsp:Transcript_28406/g.40714  ORF Transcript_28406/g.40714 Transcript_28406/m.40714 type:complete len:528 (-) Transcript_28406:47-1630(-)